MKFFSKRFIYILFFICIVVAILTLQLPSILSTDYVKAKIISKVNNQIPGSISIDKIDLHWGKGQLIEGASLKDETGRTVAEFTKLYSDITLWQLLIGQKEFGFTRVKNLNAILQWDEFGRSNLKKALGVSEEPLGISIEPKTIHVTDGQIDFYFHKNNHIPSTLQLSATTRDSYSNGMIKLNLFLEPLINTLSSLKSNYCRVVSELQQNKLEARLSKFPTILLDETLSLMGSKKRLKPIFGDTTNLKLEKTEGKKGEDSFDLIIDSSLCQANIEATITGCTVKLTTKKLIEVKDPIFLAEFQPKIFEVDRPSLLTIDIPSLEIDLNRSFDLKQISCQAIFKNLVNKNFNSKNQIYLKSSILNIKSTSSTAFNFNTKTFVETLHQESSTIISGSIELQKAYDLTKLPKVKDLAAIFEIKNLPICGYKNWPYCHIINQLVGKDVAITGMVKSLDNQSFGLDLSINSEGFKSPLIKLKLNHEISLREPISFVLPKISESTLAKITDQKLVKLLETSPLSIVVSELCTQINDLSKLKANITIDSLKTITAQVGQNLNLTFKSLQFKFYTGKNLGYPEVRCESLVSSNLFDQKVKLITHLMFEDGYKHLNVRASNYDFSFLLDGKITADNMFIPRSPMEMNLNFNCRQYIELFKFLNLNNYPELTKAPTLYLKFSPFPIDLNGNILSKLQLQANLSASEIKFKNFDNSYLNIGHLNIPLHLDFRHQLAKISFTGDLQEDNQITAKPFYLHLKLENWKSHIYKDFISNLKAEISSHLIGLPTSFIQSFYPKIDFDSIIGSFVDIEFKAFYDLSQKSDGYWDMNIDSKLFHAKSRLYLSDNITLYKSKNPTAKLRWTITPDAYKQVSDLYPIFPSATLNKPVTFEANLSSLKIPSRHTKFNFNDLIFNLNVTSSKIFIDKHDLNNFLELSIHASSDEKTAKIGFDVNVETLQGSLKIDGLLNYQQPHLEFFQLNSTNFATNNLFLLYPNLLTYKQSLELLLGKKLSLNSKFNASQNKFSLQLKSDTSQASYSGKFKNGSLIASEKSIYHLKPSVELNNYLNSITNNNLSISPSRKEPLSLEIKPENFTINLAEVTFAKATLEVGKLAIAPSSPLLGVILKLSGKKVDTLEASPVELSLREKVLTFNPFSLNLNDLFMVWLWGDYSITKNKIHLFMKLPAKYTNSLLGKFTGSQDDITVKVPMKLSDNSISIDYNKFLKEIKSAILFNNITPKAIDRLKNIIFGETDKKKQTRLKKSNPPTSLV